MSTPDTEAAAQGPGWRIELAAVLAVALTGIAPALPSGHVVGDGVDLYGTIWFYWWVERCLTTLTDPGWTPMFFFPLGKDIFAHTGNNLLDAFFSVPFQWVFGSPGYQKWVVVCILLLNAATFRVLARGLFRSGWAVFGATLAWSLNPYTLFELTAGRPTQAFLPFLPLGVHYFLQLERAEGREAWKAAAWCGVATALQAWTYWFMGWFMAFLYAWLAAHALWRSPARRLLLARYVAAGTVTVLLIAPAAVQMAGLADAGAVPGLADGSKDLFRAPQELSNNVASTLHGYLLLETVGAPVFSHLSWGGPLVLFLIWGTDRARWLPALAVLLAWAVGPVLPAGPGQDPIVLPHYMAAYHYLPFFDRLWFPYRMLSVATLVATVMGGLLLDRLFAARPAVRARAGWLLAGWALLTAVEQHRYRIYPFVSRDLSPPVAMGWIAEETGAVIHLPLGVTHSAIVWQTVHEQPMFGGMGENAPLLWPEGYKGRLRNSFIRALVSVTRSPQADPSYHAIQRQLLEEEGYRWVVLHRDLTELELPRWNPRMRKDERLRIDSQHQVTRALVEMLGPPQAVEDALVVWDLSGRSTAPAEVAYDPATLHERTWDTDQMAEYEQVLRSEGRIHEGPAPGVGSRPKEERP